MIQLRTYFIIILISLFIIGGCTTVSYKDATSTWKSHEEVGQWLEGNFIFDKDRLRTVAKRLNEQGPAGLLVRKPMKLYKNRYGYCADAAYFSIKTLNKIDPAYDARGVFIKNNKGRPNHWVAAFNYKGKLYIMDYGTGMKWKAMQGIHGPYDSLNEYRIFLESLSIPDFEVGIVRFRNMPGTED